MRKAAARGERRHEYMNMDRWGKRSGKWRNRRCMLVQKGGGGGGGGGDEKEQKRKKKKHKYREGAGQKRSLLPL